MAVTLDVNNETFMHVAALVEQTIIPIHFFCKIQVILLPNIEILAEYSNFLDVFSLDSMADLLKYTKTNDYPINLLEVNQPLYSLI